MAQAPARLLAFLVKNTPPRKALFFVINFLSFFFSYYRSHRPSPRNSKPARPSVRLPAAVVARRLITESARSNASPSRARRRRCRGRDYAHNTECRRAWLSPIETGAHSKFDERKTRRRGRRMDSSKTHACTTRLQKRSPTTSAKERTSENPRATYSSPKNEREEVGPKNKRPEMSQLGLSPHHHRTIRPTWPQKPLRRLPTKLPRATKRSAREVTNTEQRLKEVAAEESSMLLPIFVSSPSLLLL